ncbi:MAG TPA: hypothetical protein VFN67_02235, partial [Polyangiales bacterium]|nr:hypothetical protein [Polyangiales bacterium]
MKRSTWRNCRGVLGLCALGLTWALTSAGAAAQDLVVVLSSPEDEASADKLAELIGEPFVRVQAASVQAAPPTAAEACRTQARLELHLDSVGRAVRLVRCGDATVLARGVDPEAARQTPYLSAFVAAELLAINRELEAASARSAAPPQPQAAEPPPSAAAAVSSSAPAVIEVERAPAPALSAFALQVRAGAELTLWGAPFDHAVRPSFGLGVSYAPNTPAFAWIFELCAGLFATAESKSAGVSLALQRHDGELHAGARVRLGPLHLSGFALGRASLTNVELSADSLTSKNLVRLGVGAGIEA